MQEEVSAGGVIYDQGRFLVIRHARGEWLMPKGHLEAGETAEEAALREVLEETNLQARILARLGETRYTFRRKDEKTVIDKTVHWFLMELTGERAALVPRVNEGILAGEWLPLAEALERLTFPGDREMLTRAAGLVTE